MPTLTLEPITAGPFAPGDEISFELTTSSDFPELTGIFFSLTYDADLISYEGLVANPAALELPFDQEEPAGASGVTTIDNLQLGTFKGVPTGTPPSGEFVVATLEFEALAAGDVSVTLGPRQSDGNFLNNDAGPITGVDPPAPAEIVVNVPPDAVDDLVTTDEDVEADIDVLANDDNPGGPPPTIDSFTQATNGTVSQTAGGLTYTPNANFNGTDSFTYTIVDQFGVDDTATVDITVEAVNDDPEADGDEAFLDKNTSVPIPVLDNDTDVDGDTVSFDSITDGPDNGSVSVDDGVVTYTPDTDFVGSDSFTYAVSDGQGGSDTATVDITVNETNVDPVGVNDAATTDEDTPVEILVLDNDTDGDDDDLSISNFTQPNNGAVTQNGAALVYTPAANFNGTDSFSYQVDDGNGGTDLATVTVTVDPVNDAPVAADDTASVNQDGSVVIEVLDNDSDIDGDTLTIAAGAAANGTVVVTGDAFTYTPDPGFTGLDSFTYSVDDGNGGTDTATVDVAVNGITLAPTTSDPVKPGELVEIALTTSEGFEEFVAIVASLTYNADELEYVDTVFHPAFDVGDVPVPPAPSGLTTIAPIQAGDLDGDTLSGQVTVATFVFEALTTGETDVSIAGDMGMFFLDADGGSVFDGTAETTVALNSAPEADDDTVTVDEDSTTSLTALLLGNDSDGDGDPLEIVDVGQAANGTVTLVSGEVAYTPDADFFGADEFEYTLSDGSATDTATVSITVAPVNDAPELQLANTAFEVVEGDAAPLLTAAAKDVDGDTVTFSLAGAEAEPFMIDTTSGQLTFDTPPVFVDGGDNEFTFDVIASDGELTDTQSVTVSVLKDTDTDGVADNADNAVFAENPNQRDSNGDGFGNVIDGDFDGDLDIDIFDLLVFRKALGESGLTDGVDPEADADFSDSGDGSVDTEDLLAFRDMFATELTPADSAFVDIA